ncbi:MAG: hypothetical protein NZ922_00495 [Candidatus Methanomethyliaceae archaeon]|nr:hypothetical protein [Candidatus Methanomethyliaceae archaeon]MDW7970447.1 hypothetical protein [Nitrososphaerota archaeon]
MSYKKLLELWINERESKELVELSKETIEELKNYLESLEEMEDELKELREIEIQRVKWLLNNIKQIRREKIIKKMMEKAEIDDFFSKLNLTLGKRATKKILVRILQDVPSFVGADMKIYGPYKAEDVVLLPEQNAEALIKRGMAIIIERGNDEV